MEAKGFTCDQCGGFKAIVDGTTRRLPDGWQSLVPSAGGEKQLCGDECVANIAIERYEAQTGKKFARSRTRTNGTRPRRRPDDAGVRS